MNNKILSLICKTVKPQQAFNMNIHPTFLAPSIYIHSPDIFHQRHWPNKGANLRKSLRKSINLAHIRLLWMAKLNKYFRKSPKQTDFITNHIKNLNIHENTLTQVCWRKYEAIFHPEKPKTP